MRALLTSIASAGRALATVAGGRALACNSSPQCCAAAQCQTVRRILPCDPHNPTGFDGMCPGAEPVWICADARFADGQTVFEPITGSMRFGRIVVYSGLCFSRHDGAVPIPRESLKPGTNVLETGDFADTDDCAAPTCGSTRLFVRGEPCNGQPGAPPAYWCRTRVFACRTISVAALDRGWCYQVGPGDPVDEDDIPPGALKFSEDVGNPDVPDPPHHHKLCCECIAQCAVNEIDRGEPCGQNDQTGTLRCCCDQNNYLLTRTSNDRYRRWQDFGDGQGQRLAVEINRVTTRVGRLRLVDGIIVENVTQLIKETYRSLDIWTGEYVTTEQTFEFGLSPSLCSPRADSGLLWGNCPASINAATGLPWGSVQEVPGVTYTVSTGITRSCNASSGFSNLTLRGSGTTGPNPDEAYQSSNTYTWDSLGTPCTGGCADSSPPANLSRVPIHERIDRLPLSELVRLAEGLAP